MTIEIEGDTPSVEIRGLAKRRRCVIAQWERAAERAQWTGVVRSATVELHFKNGMLHRDPEEGPAATYRQHGRLVLDYYTHGQWFDPATPVHVFDLETACDISDFV